MITIGGHVHEGAEEQQHEVDQQQHHDWVFGDRADQPDADCCTWR
jgi:hypothetical protein